MRIALNIFLWMLILISTGIGVKVMYNLCVYGDTHSPLKPKKPKKDAFYAVADNTDITMFELVQWYYANEIESEKVFWTLSDAGIPCRYNNGAFTLTNGYEHIERNYF